MEDTELNKYVSLEFLSITGNIMSVATEILRA